MCSLQWHDPAVTNYLGSVVLMHAACFPHVWAFFFFPLGQNKQTKKTHVTKPPPILRPLIFTQANMPLKLSWYLPLFRGTGPRRAGLISPHRLPSSGQPWALVFTWEHWKNSTGMLARCEDDCHHWPGDLPSCSGQWGPSSGDFWEPQYRVSLPGGRKGHLSLTVLQHFWGTRTEKGLRIAPGQETLCHVEKVSSYALFLA